MAKNYYVVNQAYKNGNGEWIECNVGHFTNKVKAIKHAKNNAQNFGGISRSIGNDHFMSWQGIAFYVVKVD